MSDPRKATRPDSQQSGGKVATGLEPGQEETTPQKVSSGQTQAVGDPRKSDGSAETPLITSSAPQEEAKKSRQRAKPPTLKNLSDLLRATYGGKRISINPKKEDIAAMLSAPKLEPSAWQELIDLSVCDRILDKTRGLMLLWMERFDDLVLGSQVRDFIYEVLRRHPAFLVTSLAGTLENRPDGPSEAGAVQALLVQSYTSLQWSEGFAALKKKDAEQCRLNALCCLLLWFRMTRGTSFERIQHYLHTSIWAPTARRHKTDPQKLRALMTTRDPAGIAVACSALESKVFEQSQQVVTARRAEERASMHAKGLEEELTSVNAKLGAAITQINQLAEEISRTKHAHGDERAHMHKDYEELRGRILRHLREEVSLLDEGLHALQRDPPKIHVMVDHAERAIDALKREIERLKGDS